MIESAAEVQWRWLNEKYREPPTLKRRGRGWEVTLGKRRVLVAQSKGAQYLAVLTANPGRSIRAAELAAGPGEERLPERPKAQPMLDEVAARSYAARIGVLGEELAGLDDDDPRGDRMREEREWLFAQLRAAAGIAGHGRRAFADEEERARIAVGKAIRRALDNISMADPIVGSYLKASVHTGARCTFEPLE